MDIQERKEFHLTIEMMDNIIEKVAFRSGTRNRLLLAGCLQQWV